MHNAGAMTLYWLRYIISLVVPSLINILLLRYFAASATERNDTNIAEALILIVLLLSCAVLVQNAIKKLWTARSIENLIYLLVTAFNFIYFWYMYIYKIPIPGSMI
jgi:hypothetical protein